jgi:hypothetical protein
VSVAAIITDAVAAATAAITAHGTLLLLATPQSPSRLVISRSPPPPGLINCSKTKNKGLVVLVLLGVIITPTLVLVLVLTLAGMGHFLTTEEAAVAVQKHRPSFLLLLPPSQHHLQ